MITFEEATKAYVALLAKLEDAQDTTRKLQAKLSKLSDFQEGCVISTMDEADDYVRKGIISEGAHRWAGFFFKWLKSSGFGEEAWAYRANRGHDAYYRYLMSGGFEKEAKDYREKRGNDAYLKRLSRVINLRMLGGWKPCSVN